MELLYNPDQMAESEVKETFVAREQFLEDLVELIKGQPEGAGVQHAVIIAPRGMGKTTVLLMVKFAVKDRGMTGQWQAVKFPEESYGIYDLADLWIQTLELIAADTGDAELRRLTNDLKIEYPKNDELQEAAYAAIRYWRRKHGKRLLLLVENFDQILEQINDERDNARLRDVLMNDGTIMVLGGATNFFKEARAYDQPLYNFFKIYDLADLKLAQMQELLRRRAKVDRIADFENTLKQNASRLRALKYFTGGNPRLVLMLYRVVSRSNVTEVRRALEKLLDEVTPYYKAKVEMLPPQQRKILDHIARVSGQTSQGVTPKEIAEAVRLPQNQTSAQLKRLAELGYVRVANLRGRSSWYTLSEPLYAIWHQMRLGPGARSRMKWLVVFLRLWYSVDEVDAESRRLSIRFQESLGANRFSEASDILTHHRYLVEAMEETPLRIRALESVICSYLELKDFQTIRNDLLRGSDMSEFSEETIHCLLESGCIRLDEIKASFVSSGSIALSPEEEEIAELLSQTFRAQWDGRMEDAQTCFNKVVNLRPHLGAVWDYHGYLLFRLGHYEEAIVNYDQAVKLNPDDSDIWVGRGKALTLLGERDKALASYDHALEIKPDNDTAWFGRGIVYLQWSLELAQEGKFGAARERWNEALASGGKSNDENWPDVVAAILLDVVIAGQFEFARQLITEAGMEEQLFPLARAIDYLQTGDEALIEKLSPEVRGIVEEVVAKLKEISHSGS